MSKTFSEALQEQIAAATDELREYQRNMVSVSRELANSTVSKRSKDRALTVEIGAGNALKEIKFHGTAYRTMAPAELSALLIETINAAQREFATKMRDALLPYSGFGTKLRESLIGGTDVEKSIKAVEEALDLSTTDETWEQRRQA